MPAMYLHGWASGPTSAKGAILAKHLAASGVRLRVPDLNRPSFERLTYSAALRAIDEEVAGTSSAAERWDLIGSSMGGYLAARWAELHPARVRRLVLLCPGFDLLNRLPVVFGDAQLYERWERDGVFRPGYGPDGARTRLLWDFVLDARRHPPRPRLAHPTLIVHGRADEVIPVESSRMAARSARLGVVRVVELDDAHDLLRSSARVASLAHAWLGAPVPRGGTEAVAGALAVAQCGDDC